MLKFLNTLYKTNKNRIIAFGIAIILIGYLIYKMVNNLLESFIIENDKRYIFKNTSTNINDTISYDNQTIKYTQNTINKIATPFEILLQPDKLSYKIIIPNIPQSNFTVNLISNIQHNDVSTLYYNYTKKQIIYITSQNNLEIIDNIHAIEESIFKENDTTTTTIEPTTTTTTIEPTTTTTTIEPTTTTTTIEPTTITTTIEPTTTTTTIEPSTTKSAINLMLDSIQPVIDSSNDILESPRYKLIDNQQRLDTLVQRVDKLMNNLQLIKSISISETPKDVTFY
jgi:hypothetical protein